MGGVRAIDGVFGRGGGEREIQRRDRCAVDAWLAKGGLTYHLKHGSLEGQPFRSGEAKVLSETMLRAEGRKGWRGEGP